MIINYEDLKRIRVENETKKIVMLKGTFDLFHSGHLHIIRHAKSMGEILIVIVKSNDAVKLKGENRPIIDEKERCEIVDNIKFVDYTLLANEIFDISDIKEKHKVVDSEEMQCKRYFKIIEDIKPNVLVHPRGHKIPNALLKLYASIGTKIVEIDRDENKKSTTEIIEKIMSNSKLL